MTKRDWYIAESGKQMIGPFTDEEIVAKQSIVPPKTILIKNGVEPIYAHDTIAFAQICSKGKLLDSPDRLASVAPSSRASDNSISDEYTLVATSDVNVETDDPSFEPHNHKGSTIFNKLRGVLRRHRKRIFFSVFVVAAIGYSKTAEQNLGTVRTAQMAAKSISSSPTQAMVATISAKLARNDSAYAKALVRLQVLKDSFSPGEIPSVAFTAAVALTTLSHSELDQDSNWKLILKNMKSKGSLPALATIGYEASRISGMTEAYSMRANKLKITVPADALIEAWKAVKRIDNEWNAVPPNEQLLRNRIAAKALWNTINITSFASKDLPQKTIEGYARLATELANKMEVVDQGIITSSIQELLEGILALGGTEKSIRQRESLILDLQREKNILCNPTLSSIAPDFIVQTIAIADEHNWPQKVITKSTFDQCLIGAFDFLQVQSEEHRRTVPIAYYLPKQLSSSLFQLNSSLTKATAPQTLQTGYANLWKVYIKIDTNYNKSTITTARQRCKSQLESAKFCLNFSWHTAKYASEKLRFIPSIATAFSEYYAGAAAQSLAADIQSGLIKADSTNSEYGGELFAGVRAHIHDDELDTSTLDWYETNRSALKR